MSPIPMAEVLPSHLQGKPLVWWWFQRSDGTFHPFSEGDNKALEGGLRGGDTEVLLQEGRLVAISERMQRRGSTARRVIRATWYLKDEGEEQGGMMVPVAEEVAAEFDRILLADVDGKREQSVVIKVDGHKEEVVMKEGDEYIRVDRQTGEDRGKVVRGEAGGEEQVAAWLQRGGGEVSGWGQGGRGIITDMSASYTGGVEEGKEAAQGLAQWAAAHVPSHNAVQGMLVSYASASASAEVIVNAANDVMRGMEGEVRWIFAWGDERSFSAGAGVVLGDDDSLALELSLSRVRGGAGIMVGIGDGVTVKADAHARRGEGAQGGVEGVLVRGTWFFVRSNHSMYPFSEVDAKSLEESFAGSGSGGGFPVDVSGGRKVFARRGGGYVQISGQGARRYVSRGWPRGSVPPSPHLFVGEGGSEEEDGKLGPALASEDSREDTSGGGERGGPSLRGFRQHGQARVDERSIGLQRAVGAGVSPHLEDGGKGRISKLAKAFEGPSTWIEATRGGASGAAAACAVSTLNSSIAARAAVAGMTNEVLRRLEGLTASIPRELGIVANPLMSVTGKTVGFTSVVAGWMMGAAASAVAGGIERAGDVMDAALGAGGAVLGGVKSVVSAAEAQVVVGVEGAAIMETLVNIFQLEVANRFPEVTLMQISRGLIAYSGLQRLAKARWSHAGVADAVAPEGRGEGERAVALPDASTLGLWLRCMRFASCAYGANYMSIMGVMSASDGMGDDAGVMCKRMGLSPECIIHATWESEGFATPAWLLVADPDTKNVILVFRGTNSNSDWLTDLRCAHVAVEEAHQYIEGAGEDEPLAMHSGIWNTAVRCDARCHDHVAQALAEREGWGLILTGHSLGAGVSTLLGLRWRSRGAFPSLKVLAFAAPPVTSSLALVKQMEPYCTSIENSDDFVSRWCCGTCVDVIFAAYALASVDGVVDDITRVSLYGFDEAKSERRRQKPVPGTPEALEEHVKANNKALFDLMLKEEKESGSLTDDFFESKKGGYRHKVVREEPTREWCEEVLRACEERMTSDKLYPCGKIYWLLPTYKDSSKGDVMEKPSWVDIAAGKTKVHTLEQDVRNYGRMALSKTNISDHAITPYEVLIEAAMEQEGGEAASELSRQGLGAVSGWVHTLGSLGV